jgi:hypothetical protein
LASLLMSFYRTMPHVHTRLIEAFCLALASRAWNLFEYVVD